jgi:hypothetical protein
MKQKFCKQKKGETKMTELTVDIQTPNGMLLESTTIPDDYKTEQIVGEIVDELQLPRINDEGRAIYYSLKLANHGVMLRDGHSLRDAGVRDSDILELISSVPVSSSNEDFLNAIPEVFDDLSSGTIDVVLSVLDLNKSVQESLPLDVKVGELMRQIAARQNLPARDGMNQPVSYSIHSKALGRFLQKEMTLRLAGIPAMDRLSIHREEVAG